MFVTITDNMGKQMDVNPLHVVAMQPANTFYRVVMAGGVSLSVSAVERQKILDRGQEILTALGGNKSEAD